MNAAPEAPHPLKPSAERTRDFPVALGLLLFTGVVFWPVLRWLASQAFAREQLKQSFIIVLLAGAWIAWEKRQALRLELRFSNPTIAWLLASYALAGAALLLHRPVFVLAGLLAATGGLVSYLFGSRAFRRTVPLLIVFGLLILCVLLFPILDWPLRQMAGVESARFLKGLGLAPQLAVVPGPEVRLLLLVGARPFHVATECNGFGLITSCLLLGLILLLFRRAPVWRFLLLLPICILLAFALNTLRISAIVLLAPRFMNHYGILHEAAGQIALYTALGVVWLLTGRQKAAR